MTTCGSDGTEDVPTKFVSEFVEIFKGEAFEVFGRTDRVEKRG